MTYSRPGVYITERLLPAPITAEGTADAAGATLGAFAQGPEAVTLVTSWYDFVKKFGGYNASYPATFGVAQFFQNGGSELYVKRVLPSDAAAAAGTVPGAEAGSDDMLTVTAKNRGTDGNNLRVTVTAASQDGYYNITVYREGVAGTASNVSNDVVLEQYQNVLFTDSSSTDYAPNVINATSEHISVDVVDAELTPVSTPVPLTGGDDGTTLVAGDYTADADAFSALERPLVLFTSGLASMITATNAATVYNALIAWAENNSSFVVAETAESLTPANAVLAAGGLTASSHVGVYYPHVYISDPLGRSPQALRKIGPSGAVAGLYIATDKLYGPFKAPAGIRATIRGAVALERTFTSAELDTMNTGSRPVNVLRNLPGAGVVSMGARTLLQDGTANKYVNMRRSLNYITKQLNNLTQFALFENNDEVLWSRLRSTVAVFLNEYRNQGGLRGATEEEAFFIKVDAENNPAQSIALGEVHIEVGVALQYPAEFVVINLSQKTSV